MLSHATLVSYCVYLCCLNVRVRGLSVPVCLFQNRPRWRNRRSQRLDKMELLNLQSNLQSEIQAKQQVTNELSKVKQECVTLES